MEQEKEMSVNSSFELLVRIDERIKGLSKELGSMEAKMVTRKEFDDFQKNVGDSLANVVTQHEFKPVKTIAYSVISIVSGSILLIMVAAIIGALIK